MNLLREYIRNLLIEDNSYQLVVSPEFQEKYITSSEGYLGKASFDNSDPDEMVTDINQYGPGDYWCVTDNCEEHYQENPNFMGMSYERLPPNLQIAVGSDNAFYDNENEIRSQADGFYDPDFDTYGLVLFQRLGVNNK